MPPDTLEFEEPIALLQKEIEALAMLPQTPAPGQQDATVAGAESGGMILVPGSTSKPHAVDVLFANDSWLPSRDLHSAHLAYPEDDLTGKDEGRIGKLATVLALSMFLAFTIDQIQ